MSAITAKASRKMKKYAVLTREPRCFLGSFDFSWEQRKLGDVVKEITRNDPESEAPIMMITANNGFIEQSERYAFNNAGESLKKYILLKKGELAYNHGASKLRPYGSCFALTTAENARIPFVYHCFSAENQNAEFMSIELNGAEIENQLRKIVSSGARMDGLLNISFDEYTSVSVILPGTEEQDRIADFFRHLDNLITLHQRKCVFLFGFFQAFISMIFTASTFSWEQRKVSDLAEKTYGGGTPTTSNEAYWNGDIPWIQSSDVVDGKLLGVEPRKWITQDGLNNSAAQLIPGNSIAIITRVGVGKLAFMPYSYATSQDFLSLSKLNAEPLFTVYACYKKLQSELNAVQGTSIKGITKDELLAKNIMVPRYAEQQQIGAFFKQLDNLITLHQRECISFTARAGRLILTANKKRNTSSWEQRKFGEITSKYEDPVPTPHDGYYRLGIRSHAKGTFHSYVAKGQELETAQMHRVAAGNFIVNITFGWEHAVAITDKNDAGKLVSHRFPQFSFAEGMVPEFFRYVIVDEKFRHHLWLASPGGAGRNRVLKLDEMLNYLMRFPSRDEQIKIAEFFRHLDNLITLHQRKPFLMKWRTSDANRNQTNRLVL